MKSVQNGFTLIEVVVAAAVFVIVAVGAYQAFVGLFRLIDIGQYQELAVDAAHEEMEIIRNMPYADVGVVGSIPNGNVPYQQTVIRGNIPFTITAIIRNIDLPADGTAGGTPNDTNPADNKLVSLTVSCTGCYNMQPVTITGQVAPLALENTNSNGSLFIHVHDSLGKPIQGANVTVTSTLGATVNDVTDETGTLELVGVPPGTNAYHIVVTKAGYSTDQTYTPGAGVTNPDSTVVVGQVTDVYFFIDKLSAISVESVSPTCAAIGNYHFHLTGSKMTGTGQPKYSQDLVTNSNGLLTLNNMEWDSAGYTLTPKDTVNDLAGLNPVNPIVLNAGASIGLQLTVLPKNGNALMVSVVDSSGLPLPGVSVELQNGVGYDTTLVTGQGSINQTDWSGSSGQSQYVDPTKYDSDSFADVTSAPGNILIYKDGFGNYAPSAWLESSTFDTGTSSNFYNIIWQPTSQASPTTTVRLQFATASTSLPDGSWNFTGPDGTSGSYYTVSNSSMNPVLDGNEFARYRVYLDTLDQGLTPDVSDVGFTYTSGCIPPGQVIFQSLSTGSYTLNISKTGYTAVTNAPVTVSSGWQEFDQTLSP
ncbi:MAG: carboxypeptidase regulatory-like domain-containing protein [Patescibacteria group bacterium]|nr:carboxypeptidase regulatory-like domain-containing protein [Patescibacteria group bacterium]MDE2172494.1 carboxypeptidase regulatory-like domain-containing protein [Patescibacteria group bacterium]